MLLRAVFLIALLAMLSETMVRAAAALATSALHHRAVAASQVQLNTAIAAEQNAIAQAVAANGPPNTVPPPQNAPSCIVNDSNGCALFAQTHITLASPAPAATPCANESCALYLQGNDDIAEGRVYVNISTQITAADGSSLVTRAAAVTFRTFRTPPYALPSGALDATLDALGTQSADNGGTTGASGTLVNVEYLNAADPTATPIPGNVWQPRSASTSAAAGAWDY